MRINVCTIHMGCERLVQHKYVGALLVMRCSLSFTVIYSRVWIVLRKITTNVDWMWVNQSWGATCSTICDMNQKNRIGFWFCLVCRMGHVFCLFTIDLVLYDVFNITCIHIVRLKYYSKPFNTNPYCFRNLHSYLNRIELNQSLSLFLSLSLSVAQTHSHSFTLYKYIMRMWMHYFWTIKLITYDDVIYDSIYIKCL